MTFSRLGVALGIFFALGLSLAESCPFCSEQRGPTLTEDFAKAQVVLLGTCVNPKLGATGLEDSTTELIIEEIVKPHEAVQGLKKVLLTRYISDSKNKHLVYADVYKGKLDCYRGQPLDANSSMVKYLKGAAALQGKPPAERLRYFFDYLNFPEYEISLDAYREFAKADYNDYKDMAKKLPASSISAWMQDPKTPGFRLGLFGSLLGLCGGPDDARLLKKLLSDPETRKGTGLEGMMVGLVTIDPKDGWDFLSGQMLDSKQDFPYRYCIFRAARFLWEVRPDLVSKDRLAKDMGALVQAADMSDFAIDELRKWKRWEFTEPILELAGKKSHNLNVIRRAITRYMLQSPRPEAAAYIAAQRQRDPEWVQDVVDLLKLEAPAPVASQ